MVGVEILVGVVELLLVRCGVSSGPLLCSFVIKCVLSEIASIISQLFSIPIFKFLSLPLIY